MGKAPDDLTLLDFRGSRAVSCMLDNLRKVFVFTRLSGDMLAARIACRACGIHAVNIAVLGRDDTVGGHENGAIEGIKLLLLLPPCITVVAKEIGVFLKSRIVMGRQHF